MTLTDSQIVSHALHTFTTGIAGFLVVHGALSESVAAQIAQIAGGVVLALGASAVHSLRIWVDSKPQFASIRGIVDTIDAGVGTQTTTTTTTAPGGKAMFQEVAASIATNGVKP